MIPAARQLAAATAMAVAAVVQAETTTGPGVSNLDLVQVTADRFAEAVQEVPNSVEVITAEELRARGVSDLRSALALIGGVSVAPGGDEGPAAAVPGLLGLREVDDFLLLVDGVPAGGAFVPQFATLDLNGVERIEVQRGPAAVLWGTTAFAGTINLIHYGAGKAAQHASLAYGSFGSYEGGASAALAQGPYRASIAADGVRDRYSDARSGLDRGHLLLRSAASLGGGEARLDFDATVQHQKPSSPRPLEGAQFDPQTSIDFNQNPADGKIDSNRFQLTGAYDQTIAFGSWGSTLSLTQTHTQLVQGFFNPGSDGGSGPDNATGFHQRRELGEAYFDTHLTHRFGGDIVTTFGASELLGIAHQNSQTFSYSVPGDGGLPQSSGEGTPADSAYLSDQRSFAGLYAQTRWNLSKRLGFLAGLRLNHIDERRSGGDGDPADPTTIDHAGTTRLSGSLGANWRVWQDADSDLDDVVLYASYGNTFQPPQIDLGPDLPRSLLRPESTRSYEAGVKADGFDGRFDADLALFHVEFDNQAVAVSNGGLPGLRNGGRERYKGAELELKYRLMSRLALSANCSYNDARYRDFNTVIDGDSVQLAGNRLLLSPRDLAGLGLVWGGGDGLQASLTANYVGRRYLDMQNSVEAQSYTTLDGSLGYAFRGYAVSLNGYNLGNRRDPVLQSELGEGQFYLLPGRRLFLKLAVPI